VADTVDRERAAKEHLEASARASAELVGGDLPAIAARAGGLMAEALAAGGTIFFCGNGGSAADAQHLAAELVGRLDRGRDREPLAGLALTTDTSALTALANDFGYEEVFARQVRAMGRRGDVLVCLSTSGASPNIVRAAEVARDAGLRVVVLVGPEPSPLDDLAEVALHVPGDTSGLVQQGHVAVGHLLCELAEGAP
jgi:D-sedoheptulose 7-phosphate isomerase